MDPKTGEFTQTTQNSYSETPYEDTSWEIVGEAPGEEIFMPLEVEVSASAESVVDPMFADYGGVSPKKVKRRWHLPEQLAYTAPYKEKDETPVVESVTLTKEALESLQSELYEKGISDGQARALEQHAAELKVLKTKLTGVLQDLQNQLLEQVGHLEKEAVSLSLNISKKIVGYAVEINPEYIVQLTREAISHSGTAAIKRVLVSPEDMEFIKVVGVEQDLKDPDATWAFEADPTVKAGCVVETSAGEIDFQIDKAWERVKDNILKVTR